MTAVEPPRAVFATMGMFIVDDIEFGGKRPDVHDVVGGAGTYAVVGARVFLPGPIESRKVGWFVDAGNDFPESVRETISSWNTGVVLRETPDRLTTRGWNGYTGNEERAFKYLTPKLRIEAQDLLDYESIKHAKTLHLICSPQRCLDTVRRLREAHGLDEDGELPNLILWEPVPDECKESNYGALEDALEFVDVLSPNLKEAAAFYGEPEPESEAEVAKLAARLIRPMLRKNAAVVLRAGRRGVFVMPAHAPGFSRGHWYPAYHDDPTRSDFKVEDPTGGGNAFLGGFGAGLVLFGGDLGAAAACGNVGASFAIEQVGPPILSGGDGQELWNGVDPFKRLEAYCERAQVALPERNELQVPLPRDNPLPQQSWTDWLRSWF